MGESNSRGGSKGIARGADLSPMEGERRCMQTMGRGRVDEEPERQRGNRGWCDSGRLMGRKMRCRGQYMSRTER